MFFAFVVVVYPQARAQRRQIGAALAVRAGSRATWMGLQRVLSGLLGGGVGERKSVRRAAKNTVLPDITPNGSLFKRFSAPSVRGPALHVLYADPASTLTVLAQAAPKFWAVFEKLSHLQPPLGLVIYNDGATGGNVLDAQRGREAEMVYWTAIQLGDEFIADIDFWIPLVVAKTEALEDIDGGMTTIFSRVVTSFFGQTERFSCRVYYGAGVYIDLTFGLHAVLTDESAQASCLSTKGASGLKPCPFCANVVSYTSKLAEHSPTLVVWGEHNAARLRLHTDQNLRDIWVALEACPPKQRKQLEKDTGFKYHPEAALAKCPAFKPMSQAVDDSMHTFAASNGTCCSELIDLIGVIEEHKDATGVSEETLIRFCTHRDWHWPVAATPRNTWFTARIMETSKTAGYYRGSASAVLSLVTIVAHFCQEVLLLHAELRAAATSFIALGKLMDFVFQRGRAASVRGFRFDSLQKLCIHITFGFGFVIVSICISIPFKMNYF